MSELLDIIISAVDEASDTFQSIVSSAEDAQDSLEGMSDSAETVPSDAIQETADATHEVEEGASGAGGEIENISNILTAFAGAEIFNQMADALWDLADKAGTVQDSINRASLEAEGFGISADSMKSTVSELSSETGRAGGQIREAFIKATARGVTDLGSFKTMMEGASAQAFLLGTDVQTMGNKFSQMAMRSTLMERGLAETGITMKELADAMGMSGATADEVKDKWKELDENQRAAILGQAASMNEGEEANEAYKNSWEGLQAQIDIARGKLEVLAGKVLLPVLVPALEIAGRILGWLGDTLGAVMDGPLGGFISIIGSLAAGIALAVPAIAAIQAAMTLFEASIWPAITASWALLAPWLPWIAIGAAIVAIIYEVGKAFGWWSDAGSMIDAISAGLQRLWSAFINNPDVQAFLQAMSEAFGVLWEMVQQAGQAILDFFGISNSGEFDIVRALIDGVGIAFNNIKTILQPVITLVWGVINAFNQFRTGQIDLPTFIWNVLTLLAQAYTTIFSRIIGFVARFASQMIQRAIIAATNFVNNIITRIKQLPGRIYSALIAAVSRIVSAGQQWVNAAKNKASSIVSNVYNTLTGLPGKIASALSGVVSAFTKPFTDAYNKIKEKVDQIKEMASNIPIIGGAFGGDDYVPAGAMAGVDLSRNSNITTTTEHKLTGELTLIHDLRNLPKGITAEDVANLINETATSDEFGKNLARNMSFQEYDLSVKQKIVAKNNRSRGIGI